MSGPASDYFEVQRIPNAGRGVVATQSIPAGTILLESAPPAVHVTFKQYRKETCAYCFEWDRGRTLPIRANDMGKVFCTPECQAEWLKEQGELGTAAWRSLIAFANSKAKGTNDDELMADGERPGSVEISTAWQKASEQAKMLLNCRDAAEPLKRDKKTLQAVRQRLSQPVDPDTTSYFLCAFLARHRDPLLWDREILSLAMDEKPYKSLQDLENSCTSFLHLASILPPELLPSLTPDLCLSVVQADNHNAFGIRGGGEDSEEYMGYAVYPSASYFNHSCSPNVSKKRNGRCWTFRAARDISPGEECCITYLGGDEMDLNVFERVQRLNEHWAFTCVCQRCKAEASM